LGLEPSCVEVAFERLERYKSPGIDQILAEIIQVGGNTLHSEVQKLTNCIWNREELPQHWKESVIPECSETPLLINFAIEYVIRKVKKMRKVWD
jgi:hypothetical protein